MKNENLELAHQTSRLIVEKFIRKISIGMGERSLVKMFLAHQREFGHLRNWHPPNIRVGENTIYSFDSKSPSDAIIREGDLVSIDVGMIVNEYESDYAQTIPMGKVSAHSRRICDDAQDIWKTLRALWKEKNLSGREIYRLAEDLAAARGWTLDRVEGGHPIGKFPHSRLGPQVLADLETSPLAYEWILEIKLLEKEKSFGAFYEEILR